MISFIRGAFLVCALSAFIMPASAQKKKDHTPVVNPFIGTQGKGHTYPGAVLPFGMAQASPVTRASGAAYNGADTILYGFSNIRYNLTDSTEQSEILFMPTIGEPKLKLTDNGSAFKKKYEEASPGHYEVELENKIKVELTVTARAALHSYDFPTTPLANIIVDLQYGGETTDAGIEVVNNNEVKGYRLSKTPFGNRHVYFYAKFSKPFKTYGIASGDAIQQGKNKLDGKNIKMYLQFDNPGEVVVKVGLSHVSTDGALKNLDAEIPAFEFSKIQKAARLVWSNELSKIEAEGGAPATPAPANNQQSMYGPYRPTPKGPKPPDYAALKQTTFYTALYHTMLTPNITSDVDGQYRNNNDKVVSAKGFTAYDLTSFRDAYGPKYSLLTLIDQKRTLEIIKSYLELSNADSLTNILTPLITDAYAKGIKDFDVEKAYNNMKALANSTSRQGYIKYGYVPSKEPASVTKTLHYAYNDWCIAQLAKLLNKPQDYTEYIQRAQYWKNLINPISGYLQARTNGTWAAPFNPVNNSPAYQGNSALQYNFTIPFDIDELSNLMGGKDNFEQRLDELFTNNIPGNKISIGQYIHGAAYNYHVPYLYDFTGSSQKTQAMLNRLNKAYNAEHDGLINHDTDGQLSAWYVLSSLGIYNLSPGQQQYIVGLPQFDKAAISLENGKKFTILNGGASFARNSFYIQGLNLDKKDYNKLFINYEDIAKGGDFEIFTGTLPNKLVMDAMERPSLKVSAEPIVPKPVIEATPYTTKQPGQIILQCADKDANIYYTLDGSTPSASSKPFGDPFILTADATIKVIAIKNGKASMVEEGFYKK